MKLIVGLGNPGKGYINTRHNMGFRFIDYYLKANKVDAKWVDKFDGLLFLTFMHGEKVLFVKPQTYMNKSGRCVKQVVDYFKINIDDILVISDDLDLNLGVFKLKKTGSCGGHNGLRSIEFHLGTQDYKRLKIGVSNNKDVETKDYVLGDLSDEENKILDDEYNSLVEVVDNYFSLSFEDLMSRYNRKNK